MNKHAWFLTAAALLGLSSLFEVRLSIFAFLLLVIALASLTRFDHQRKRAFSVVLALSTVCSVLGLGLFITTEALPGIIDARARASSSRAVSILREFLFAQDAMRRHGWIDPDGDGVGSAGRLGELTGTQGIRDKGPLPQPPLSPRYAPRRATASGPATEHDGYLFIICLPGENEPWVTDPRAAVDDERAEERWVAYAWPAGPRTPHKTAFFIDEHERILQSDARGDSELRLMGHGLSPACDDALAEPTRAYWTPWRGKKPREALPGAGREQ